MLDEDTIVTCLCSLGAHKWQFNMWQILRLYPVANVLSLCVWYSWEIYVGAISATPCACCYSKRYFSRYTSFSRRPVLFIYFYRVTCDNLSARLKENILSGKARTCVTLLKAKYCMIRCALESVTPLQISTSVLRECPDFHLESLPNLLTLYFFFR